jgi:hypothetical protein
VSLCFYTSLLPGFSLLIALACAMSLCFVGISAARLFFTAGRPFPRVSVFLGFYFAMNFFPGSPPLRHISVFLHFSPDSFLSSASPPMRHDSCFSTVWVWALKPSGTRCGERGSWNKEKRQIHFVVCATTHITVFAFLLGFQSWDPYTRLLSCHF